MERDEKSKRNEKEIVKKLYKEEREKLDKMPLRKIDEKEKLYSVKEKILKSVETRIKKLFVRGNVEKLVPLCQKELLMISEVTKTRQVLWDKTSSEEKAEYEYQKVLVEYLKECLEENYKVIPIKDFEGKLQFKAIDKKNDSK